MTMHLAMLIFSEKLFQGISEELLLSATRVVDKELTVKTIVCHLCSCYTNFYCCCKNHGHRGLLLN